MASANRSSRWRLAWGPRPSLSPRRQGRQLRLRPRTCSANRESIGGRAPVSPGSPTSPPTPISASSCASGRCAGKSSTTTASSKTRLTFSTAKAPTVAGTNTSRRLGSARVPDTPERRAPGTAGGGLTLFQSRPGAANAPGLLAWDLLAGSSWRSFTGIWGGRSAQAPEGAWSWWGGFGCVCCWPGAPPAGRIV